MPQHGQLCLLGARSERLARHEARAWIGGDRDGIPTKGIKTEKYKSKEEYADVARRRRNKARAERRRRARKRLMAAETEATTKMQTRGGKKPRKKTAVRKRYRQELQKKIQQRRRHREVNRQIWARLQALTDKVQSTETALLQLVTGEEKTVRNHPTDQKILEQAMAGRHWVAIGDEDEDNQAKASVGRQVKDGMLFKVAVTLNSRRCIALIDSGASQSYVSPEIATLAELNCVPSVLFLELADGSKIQSTEQAQDVVCNIGELGVHMNFTVTKLLSDVDCVLGMDWLQYWNPVIDWKKTNYVFVCKRSLDPGTRRIVARTTSLWNCKDS